MGEDMLSLNNLKYIITGLATAGILYSILFNTFGMYFAVNSSFAPYVVLLFGISFGALLSRILLKKKVNDSFWLLGLSSFVFSIISIYSLDIGYYVGYLILGLIIGILVLIIGKIDMKKKISDRKLRSKHYGYLRHIPIISLFITGFALLPLFIIGTGHTNEQTLATVYCIAICLAGYLYGPKDPQKSFNVLFLGHRSSGKTVLAIGLNKIITSVFGGSPKNPVDMWVDNIQTMNELRASFDSEGYEGIESTFIFGIHPLKIRANMPKSLKNSGVSEIVLELVDYRGEHLNNIAELSKNPGKLEERLNELREELNGETNKTINNIISDLKSGKFRRFTKYMSKDKWKSVDVNLVGPLYLLSRIKSSNSLIFLVDGKKLLDYLVDRNPTLSIIRDSDKEFYEKIKSEKTVEQNILKDLSNYATIISSLEKKLERKKVFFVITKSDVIADAFQRASELLDEDEDIIDYEDIKDGIVESLLTDTTMKAICNDVFGANIDKKEIKNQICMVSVRPNEEPNGIKDLIDGVLKR